MKPRTKIAIVALVVSALVLAFTACAGCTGTDPIVGTYVTSELGIEIILDFHDDGTYDVITTDLSGNTVNETNIWEKVEGKKYTSKYDLKPTIFQLSDDSKTLSMKKEGESSTLTLNKFSDYTIPTSSPKKEESTTQSSSSTTKIYSVGDLLSEKSNNYKCTWGITECLKGKDAYTVLSKGSDLSLPNSAYEYLLCHYTITNTGDTLIPLNNGFSFQLRVNGNSVDPSSLPLPIGYDPLESVTLNKGESASGWLVYLIPTYADLSVYLKTDELKLSNSLYIKL